jgi:hypothetical protein
MTAQELVQYLEANERSYRQHADFKQKAHGYVCS